MSKKTMTNINRMQKNRKEGPGKAAEMKKLWKNHSVSALIRCVIFVATVLTVAVLLFLVGFIVIKGVGNLTLIIQRMLL